MDVRPNVILLLADDLGYNELGSYGQEIIETPNLDQLAKDGLRFTNFYAGNAACAPSSRRATTGRRPPGRSSRPGWSAFSTGRPEDRPAPSVDRRHRLPPAEADPSCDPDGPANAPPPKPDRSESVRHHPPAGCRNRSRGWCSTRRRRRRSR